jgi:hypothetical protein
VDESASTAEEQRIAAMDRETEARWQRVIIEENPAFSRLMGVRFTSGSRDRIEAELTVGEELANRNGVMHGGALMAFAGHRQLDGLSGRDKARGEAGHTKAYAAVATPVTSAQAWKAWVRAARYWLAER